MDTSLDNANNPFANSNGSENTMTTTETTTPLASTTIDPDSLKTDGFLLNLSQENNYKQNGSDVDDLLSSPTNDFYRKLEKSNGKRSASEFDEDDDDDLNDNDNVIDNDNERDEDDNEVVVDDDLGPETDVDTADVLSPSILTAKALADGIINNNPEGSFNPFIEKEEVEKAALEIDRIVDDELQKQQISDDEDEIIVERKSSPSPLLQTTTITPPLISEKTDDVVPVNPANVSVHDVGSLEDNVADSGDDSEDEWNYIKGDEANKENLNPAQPEQEEVAASFEEDIDSMSQLNPNAAEFVPVSPTRSIPSPACQALINDPVISQSPKRANDIDLSVPNPQEFENEVKSRPSDVGSCDNNSNGHEEVNDHKSTTQEFENLLNGKNIDEIPEFQPGTVLTPTKISHDEFHFGPNAAPFTPGKLLDQSEAGLSTKAVYGDESTATIPSFDESSAFGQDHTDFTSLLNKENDPMSMSFYQEKSESDIIDLNRVQPLPDDLDEFLNKPDKPQQLEDTVIIRSEKSEDIINLDNDERVQTTDLDKIIDSEKEIASPVDNDLSDDVCELPKSPDLITNDIIEKENEEEKEKADVNEKDEEEIKETEKEEDAVCDMISSKSPELVAVSPESPQSDLLQNQNTFNQANQQLIEEEIAEIKEHKQQQQSQQDDLIEHKSVTPEPEIEAAQEQLNTAVNTSPLPTHELLTSSPEIPVEAALEISQSEIPQSAEITFESDQCKHEETQIIDNNEISTNIEKNEESVIASPVEDVTSSVKDTASPVVMSPIPDQETIPASEQEILPVDESSPIIQKQSEVLVPEVCPFSPPESVATVEVNSFLERSEVSDVHSPLEASSVATVQLTNDGIDQPIESNQLNILDADHPLSKCVYPLPTENEIPIKTEEIVDDNKMQDKVVENSTTIPVIVEEVVEEKPEQTENILTSEVSTTTVATASATAAVATAATAAAVVEKITDKAKTATKKSPAAASKAAASKSAAAISKTKPSIPKSPSAASSRSTTNVVSQKPLSPPTKTTAASKIAAKPKTGSLTTAKSTTDKKPLANGDVKSTKATTLVKKTESTKTTAKPLASARPVSSTLNKISPIKSRPTTAPNKVGSSTTNKTSSLTSTTTTTTTASAKPRPGTLTSKTAATNKASSTSVASKSTATKTTSSTKTLSSPRAPRPPTTTITVTAKPKVPITKTIAKTSADTEKQNKESANKLTASRSTTATATRTTGKTITSTTTTTTLKKTELKNSGTRTTATKTTTTVTGKKPTEVTRNIKTTTTKTTKIEKPIQNGISSVVTEQIIVNNDNEPQLVKDNSPIDNKLIVESTTTD